MTSRATLLSSASLLALLAAGPAMASDMTTSRGPAPAVSAFNAKVGGFGASLEDESAGGGFISLAFPLRSGWGAQVDGMVGGGDGGAFYGGAAHLFWRDPSRGLLGAYASYTAWDTDAIDGQNRVQGADVGKVGIEAHAYLGRVSLEGIAAYQFGTLDGFAGKAALAYYPRDDFRLHLGASHLEGAGASGFAGMEWMVAPERGLSFFADVGVNEDSDVRTLAGLKLYLSPESKSLIRRHREDDPDVDLPGDLFHAVGRACPAGQVLINGFCDGNS